MKCSEESMKHIVTACIKLWLQDGCPEYDPEVMRALLTIADERLVDECVKRYAQWHPGKVLKEAY